MNYDRTANEYLENKAAYIPIDIRSPIEFQDSHIPNAINIPLFSDSEREEVGTLYKQKGKAAAKWRSMEIVSPKLPFLLREIQTVAEKGKTPFIYCWRGGMRSQSLLQFATMAGLKVHRLEGGFRSYRQTILEQTKDFFPNKAIVLYGMTGTGKTDILHNLKKQGYPVLDLEQYANHKGSVFGAITGEMPHNQKMFDTLLFEDLHEMKGTSYFFMEGESKRIGHAIQPPELLERKDKGIHIRVVANVKTRVERIYEQYVSDSLDSTAFSERVEVALHKIMKRIKPFDVQQQLQSCLEEKNYKEMIRLLIEYYYDPRYDNKINESIKTELEVNSDSLEEATEKIIAFIEEKLRVKQP